MADQHDEEPQAPRPDEGCRGQPPMPASEDSPRAFTETSIDGFHPLHDRESEGAQSQSPAGDGPFSPLPPVTFTIAEPEGQGLSLHPPNLQGSAELESFIVPSENPDLELESETRVEDISPFPKPMTASMGSLGVEYEDHLLPQAFSSEEVATQTHTPRTVKPLWKVWALEMACILLSFSAFVLIVVVLSKLDQQGLPDWPLKITLNTFLAFFTTLTKAAFMLPVSIAISHSQWRWFLQERPLYDFHILDQASRGSWGSLILLWRIRCRHFVALGALLMVVSTLTSSVTQLAINYPVRDVVASGEAYTSAIRTVNSPRDRMDIGTRKAVLMATVADGTGFLRPISPLGASCSTGNCTFDRYQSLGVCTKMANISSQLRIEEFENRAPLVIPLLGDSKGASIIPGQKIWKASLPGGCDLAHQTTLAVLSDTLNGHDSFGFQNNASLLQTRIASFVLIYTTPVNHNNTWKHLSDGTDLKEMLDDIHEFRHEALEVLFHLCVQSYDTSVHRGVEKTRLVSSLAKPVEQEARFFLDVDCKSLVQDKGLGCKTNPSRWNDTIHLESPTKAPIGLNSSLGEGFCANYRSLEMMATTLKSGLGGYARARYHPRYFPNPEVLSGGEDFVHTLFQDVLFELDNMVNHTRRYTCLTNLYTNIAATLSSTMRIGQPQKYTRGAYNITGQAWKEESYVHVTWGWISFLAIELVIATGFLTLTIITQSSIRSKRGSNQEDCLVFRDIKDSPLATLVALSKECCVAAGGGLQPMDELTKTARRLRVRLEGNKVVPLEVVAETPPPRGGQHQERTNYRIDGSISAGR